MMHTHLSWRKEWEKLQYSPSVLSLNSWTALAIKWQWHGQLFAEQVWRIVTGAPWVVHSLESWESVDSLPYTRLTLSGLVSTRLCWYCLALSSITSHIILFHGHSPGKQRHSQESVHSKDVAHPPEAEDETRALCSEVSSSLCSTWHAHGPQPPQ